MTQIKLGILGAGLAVEHLHWPALCELRDEFVVTAICDRSQEAAERIAQLVGGEPSIFSAWEAFFSDSSYDAVLISLPIHLNADAMRAAARAGKHIICEKPLAANLAQAEHLAEELRHLPTVVVIAENIHYRDDLKQARRWIDAGRIGSVCAISVVAAFWSDTSQGFSSTPWRHDHQYRGAVIADAGVHHAALLRELGGEIEQIHAFYKDVHPVLKGPDTAVVNIRYESGVLGQLLFAAASKPVEPSFDTFVVLGTAGSISGKLGVVELRGADGEQERYEAQDPKGYVGEFRNFHRAITAGEPVIATLDEALADWRVIMKALDAAESRSVQII